MEQEQPQSAVPTTEREKQILELGIRMDERMRELGIREESAYPHEPPLTAETRMNAVQQIEQALHRRKQRKEN